MNRTTRIASVGLIATFAVGMVAPMAQASDQSNKNNWRNIAIGAGAATLYGLTQHNSTVSVLGALGTAYSLKRYEDARHKQSVDSRYRAYYHRRYSHWHSGYYTRDRHGVRHWHGGYWTR